MLNTLAAFEVGLARTFF